jgi:hypothetical protein
MITNIALPFQILLLDHRRIRMDCSFPIPNERRLASHFDSTGLVLLIPLLFFLQDLGYLLACVADAKQKVDILLRSHRFHFNPCFIFSQNKFYAHPDAPLYLFLPAEAKNGT